MTRQDGRCFMDGYPSLNRHGGSLVLQNLGCNRLQICEFLARFCRDMPSQPLELVDVSMDRMNFETRHPPQFRITSIRP